MGQVSLLFQVSKEVAAWRFGINAMTRDVDLMGDKLKKIDLSVREKCLSDVKIIM